MTNTNIYILIDPRNGEIRYIGQAQRPGARYRQHCSNPQWRHQLSAVWLRRLAALGLQPQLKVVERGVPLAREAYWIAHYRALGHDVLNQVGPGCDYAPDDERIAALLTEQVQAGEFVGQRGRAPHLGDMAPAAPTPGGVGR